MKWIDDYRILLLLCFTLGLAPFFPEPHLWGKIKWVVGGGIGMKFMDWFDILLHGFPFLLLLRRIALTLIKKKSG